MEISWRPGEKFVSPPIREIAGRNGVIVLYGEGLAIVRGGCRLLGVRGKPDVSIYYPKLTGINWKEPTDSTSGFIQFLHPGSQEQARCQGFLNGAYNAARDRYAVMFTKKQRNAFYAAKEFVERRIGMPPSELSAFYDSGEIENPLAGLSAIEILAELRSQGIITDQQFEKRKRKILGV